MDRRSKSGKVALISALCYKGFRSAEMWRRVADWCLPAFQNNLATSSSKVGATSLPPSLYQTTWILKSKTFFERQQVTNIASQLRRAAPRRAAPRRAAPRRAAPRHATPRHATPRHATPRHATPRHATPQFFNYFFILTSYTFQIITISISHSAHTGKWSMLTAIFHRYLTCKPFTENAYRKRITLLCVAVTNQLTALHTAHYCVLQLLTSWQHCILHITTDLHPYAKCLVILVVLYEI